MKGIIKGVGMIVFAGAVVAGGTGAFFSDTETSTANVFTAGAIDLKVDSVAHINGLVCFDDGQVSQWLPETVVTWNASSSVNELTGDAAAAIIVYNTANPANVPQAGTACEGTWALTDLGPTHTFFDYGDLKPGDNGENTLSLHVVNNDAYMCATISNVESADNTQTEPESVVDVNGTTTGELDQELSFFIWEDDGDNIFETGEQVLANDEDGVGIAGTYPLFTPQTGAIQALETTYVGVYWCYGDLTVTGTTLSCSGESVTNLSQTDSLKADISFYIEQARNNENFRCPGVVEEPEPVATTTLTLAKTVTPAEVIADSAFTLTATGSSTISGIEGALSVTNAVVLPGDYTLGELPAGPGGEVLTWSCTGNATPEVGSQVTIALGEAVTCEATNTYTT